MADAFRVKRADRAADVVEIGEVVWGCVEPDYGMAADDSVIRGFTHISVTKDRDGGYPFFTIPRDDVEAVDG